MLIGGWDACKGKGEGSLSVLYTIAFTKAADIHVLSPRFMLSRLREMSLNAILIRSYPVLEYSLLRCVPDILKQYVLKRFSFTSLPPCMPKVRCEHIDTAINLLLLHTYVPTTFQAS